MTIVLIRCTGRWHGFALELVERRIGSSRTVLTETLERRWRFVGWGHRARTYSEWNQTLVYRT